MYQSVRLVAMATQTLGVVNHATPFSATSAKMETGMTYASPATWDGILW